MIQGKNTQGPESQIPSKKREKQIIE